MSSAEAYQAYSAAAEPLSEPWCQKKQGDTSLLESTTKQHLNGLISLHLHPHLHLNQIAVHYKIPVLIVSVSLPTLNTHSH